MLSTEQAAKRLNVHPATLAKWRRRHYGPAFLATGRKIQYEETRLEAWVEKQTHYANDETAARDTGTQRGLASAVRSEEPKIRKQRFGGNITSTMRRLAKLNNVE